MHRSMWTYAWDILDLGFDTVLGELRDRAGVDCISLASSYHAGRFLQPRSPKRKAYFPEDGTIYFHPTPARWEGSAIKPKVAKVIVEGRRRSSRARAQTGRRRTEGVLLDGLSSQHPARHAPSGRGHAQRVRRPKLLQSLPIEPGRPRLCLRSRRRSDPLLQAGSRRTREPVLHGIRSRVPSREGRSGPNRGGRFRVVALLLRLLSRPREQGPASTAKPRAASSRNGSSRHASGKRRNRASRIFRPAASRLSGHSPRFTNISCGAANR